MIRDWADGKMTEARGCAAPPFAGRALPYLEYDRDTAERGGVAGAEDGLSRRLPATVPHPLIIIRTGGNLGFAGGNNVGLRYAGKRGAEYVFLLNNDAALASRDALTHLVGFLDQNPDAGACGGRLFYPDGSAQTSYGNFPSLPRALAYLFPAYKLLPAVLFRKVKRANVVPDAAIHAPLAIDYPSGACFLVRSRTIDEVGLLDERFFMYAEETDWCLRMRERGWGRYYVPHAEVVHRYAGSFDSSAVKMNRYYLDSLFKYYRKNFTVWRLWLLVAGYFLRSLYSILRWTIAAGVLPRARRLSAQDPAGQWRQSLRFAVTTMQDLITGALSRERTNRRGDAS